MGLNFSLLISRFSFIIYTFAPRKHVLVMKKIGFALVLSWCGLWTTHARLPFHVVILGDSNTFIGGDECDKPQGWNKWFKNLAKPLSCRSYARSGATWTHTPDTEYDVEENIGVLGDHNVVYNQVNRLKETVASGVQPTPDLILIMAGTNDLWFADKRPDCLKWRASDIYKHPVTSISFYKPSELTQLSACVCYDCELLKEAFPQARIILITPPQNNKTDLNDQHDVGTLIQGCAEILGLDFIRLDKAYEVFYGPDLIRRGYSKDGVHTTPKGAKVLGKYIYNQVQAILRQ